MTTSPTTPDAADQIDTDAMRAGLDALVASSDRADITRAADRIRELCNDVDRKVGR